MRLWQATGTRQSLRRGHDHVGTVHEEKQIRLQQVGPLHFPQVEQGTSDAKFGQKEKREERFVTILF